MTITYYRLGDTPTQDECDALGVLRKDQIVTGWEPPKRDGEYVRAKYTYARRAPRKGEWYLSGSTVLAYRAPNGLNTEYHIAELVVISRKTKEIIRELR